MRKKYFLLPLILLGLLFVLTVGVSAAESEDVAALKITPGRTVSVTLPESVGNYTYNEDVVTLKGFSTDEHGATILLFACKDDIPMGTYDLLYIDGESSMGISVYGMGDANMDGDVSARDVVLMKQAIVGMAELSETQRIFSNVYGKDNAVNARDAVLVLQHIVGMDVTLGTPEDDSAVCSGVSLSIIDGFLYATYIDNPDAPINLGKVVGEAGPQGPQGEKGDTGTQGPQGEAGIGIASVRKTGTLGLVDTYTITYTNGDTTTFTVTNGADGNAAINFDLLMNVQTFDENMFKRGICSPYNGMISPSSNHIYTPYVQQYPFAVHIKAQADYRFSVCFYESDGVTFAGGSTSTQSLTVPANTPFRITLQSYWADREITDVSAYARQLTITGNPFADDVGHLTDNYTPIAPEPLTVKGINHTGWWQAPPNTLPAYKQSKKHGFTFVECDIRFTKDNVPVLLHDTTINSTARNADGSPISQTVNIADITLEEAKKYDFGIAFDMQYAGTTIPSLEEFLTLCKRLGLYPYIDIKDVSITQNQADAIGEAVRNSGFQENITFLVWSHAAFDKLQGILPKARYGFTVSNETHENSQRALLDMYKRANAFLNVSSQHSDAWIAFCKQYGIPVEAWTLDTEDAIVALDPYITGVTSNKLNAEKVLEEYYMKN